MKKPIANNEDKRINKLKEEQTNEMHKLIFH